MRVLVIGGGISDERDVSLRSAKSIFDAIPLTHEKYMYDWDGSSDWLSQNAENYDVALPILHGVGGEDGQIQAILENVGLAYLGSGIEVSKACMDKQKTQTLLADNGILVPKQEVVTKELYINSELSKTMHVLKPIDGGSSLDTFICRDGLLSEPEQIKVFQSHKEMILEEFIEGEEVTVPVLDGYDLPLIHIIPPEGKFFDYENKYNGATQEICNPDTIDQAIQVQARDLAKKVHTAMNCRHFSRVDIIIDKQNRLYVLEINTIPGLTDQSLFPKSAQYIGLSMPELVEHFITLASQSNVNQI